MYDESLVICQQTDPAFPYNTGLPGWGCRIQSSLAIPQFEFGVALSPEANLTLFECLIVKGLIRRHGPAEKYQLDMHKGVVLPIQYAADWMSPGTFRVIHQGDESTIWGPHNYQLRKNITHKRYDKKGNQIGGGGPHWTLEDYEGWTIYNPDLSLGFDPTDHFLRIQIYRRTA